MSLWPSAFHLSSLGMIKSETHLFWNFYLQSAMNNSSKHWDRDGHVCVLTNVYKMLCPRVVNVLLGSRGSCSFLFSVILRMRWWNTGFGVPYVFSHQTLLFVSMSIVWRCDSDRCLLCRNRLSLSLLHVTAELTVQNSWFLTTFHLKRHLEHSVNIFSCKKNY